MSCIKCPPWSKGRVSESETISASNTPIRSPSIEDEVGVGGLNQWRRAETGSHVSMEDIIELANGDVEAGHRSQEGHHARASTRKGPRMFVPRRTRVKKNMSEKAKDVAIPLLLHSFLDFMYYSGLTEYNRFKLDPEEETCFDKTLDVLQKVFYWLNLIPSLLQSLYITKLGLLNFLDEQGVVEFVDFSFFAFILITKFYSAFLFIFGRDGVTTMLKEMETSALENKHASRKQIKRKVRSSCWIHILGISSILVNILRVIFGDGFSDWSLESLLQDKYGDIQLALFAWKPSHLYSQTGTNSTFEWPVGNSTSVADGKSQSTMPFSTTVGGIVGIILDVCSGIHLDSIRDLITVTSATLNKNIAKFVAKIKGETMMHLEDCFGLKNYAKFEEDWTSYRMLKRVLKSTNQTFDVLLKLMHINHLLLFPYFMSICLGKETISGVRVIILIYNLIKTLITLFIARKMAESNEICRKWIWIWGCENGSFCVNNQVWNVGVALDELDKEPLGLGKGNFLIDESFLFRFFGLVGSVFMLLADDKKKSFKLKLR